MWSSGALGEAAAAGDVHDEDACLRGGGERARTEDLSSGPRSSQLPGRPTGQPAGQQRPRYDSHARGLGADAPECCRATGLFTIRPFNEAKLSAKASCEIPSLEESGPRQKNTGNGQYASKKALCFYATPQFYPFTRALTNHRISTQVFCCCFAPDPFGHHGE